MYYARDAPLSEIEFSTFYWQRKNRADIVNDDIMCFDIETSSAFKHKDSDTLEPYTGKSIGSVKNILCVIYGSFPLMTIYFMVVH